MNVTDLWYQFREPLLGGILIGFAAGVLWLFYGKVLGVSGILGTLVDQVADNLKGRGKWVDALRKSPVIVGLVLGGFLMPFVWPKGLDGFQNASLLEIAIAGILVGYGTRLGGGCTSGHGICGIARFSKRSIVATVTFMITGALAVFVRRLLIG
ncbi:MAG: hypothetical protein RIQ81_29 [Pseudomonadota bacterium]